MLHHETISNDVTGHVTHGITRPHYLQQKNILGTKNGNMGESTFSDDYANGASNKKYYQDRHSTDVDDGVISSDGDYDAAGQNMDALEIADEIAEAKTENAKEKSDSMRLSHAESTDSGMGFSDNQKDADTSRLSADIINPPPSEEHENRKSLLDGDAEYDEVIEFMSSPTEDTPGCSNTNPDTFKTPKKTNEESSSPGDSASKYAELDLAKILHTRKRHRHTSTITRVPTEEEKLPDESSYNSLKRKPKSKNYAMSGYATVGRNRKPSKQPSTESWGSRPASTCNDDSFPARSHSTAASFARRHPKGGDADNTFGRFNTMNPRRNNYSNDLMMTSDVNDDFTNTSATIDRCVWRKSPEKAEEDLENSAVENANDSNRWSWLSNSSQSQSFSSEKDVAPNSKSPWRIFWRLLGGRSKNKSAVDGATSTQSLTAPRPRSTSLFRRLSTRKSNKNQLNKRRNSVPVKSEWDVTNPNADDADVQIHIPVMDARKERPTAPRALAQKPRGRLSTRLMSFRGGKNRNSKRKDKNSMSKGLSISSPQLAMNAIDPTRNYSEHQLLNLSNLSIKENKR